MPIEDIIRKIIREELAEFIQPAVVVTPEPVTTLESAETPTEEVTPDATEEELAETEETQPTLDELRDLIRETIGRIKKPAVAKIMKEHGSTKVSDFEGKGAQLAEALRNA